MQGSLRRTNFSLREGGGSGQPNVTWGQVEIVVGVVQNLDVLLLQEGHSDLGFLVTGVRTKEKVLTGANGWALLAY